MHFYYQWEGKVPALGIFFLICRNNLSGFGYCMLWAKRTAHKGESSICFFASGSKMCWVDTVFQDCHQTTRHSWSYVSCSEVVASAGRTWGKWDRQCIVLLTAVANSGGPILFQRAATMCSSPIPLHHPSLEWELSKLLLLEVVMLTHRCTHIGARDGRSRQCGIAISKTHTYPIYLFIKTYVEQWLSWSVL